MIAKGKEPYLTKSMVGPEDAGNYRCVLDTINQGHATVIRYDVTGQSGVLEKWHSGWEKLWRCGLVHGTRFTWHGLVIGFVALAINRVCDERCGFP